MHENEVWAVYIDECIKLLGTVFLKHEAASARGERTAGNILECVRNNFENYADAVRFVIVRLGSKRTTATWQFQD